MPIKKKEREERASFSSHPPGKKIKSRTLKRSIFPGTGIPFRRRLKSKKGEGTGGSASIIFNEDCLAHRKKEMGERQFVFLSLSRGLLRRSSRWLIRKEPKGGRGKKEKKSSPWKASRRELRERRTKQKLSWTQRRLGLSTRKKKYFNLECSFGVY